MITKLDKPVLRNHVEEVDEDITVGELIAELLGRDGFSLTPDLKILAMGKKVNLEEQFNPEHHGIITVDSSDGERLFDFNVRKVGYIH